MSYKKIISKTLAELPAQLKLLKPSHPAAELKSYEKRMRDGLDFLNNLKDKKTTNLIELIRKHPVKLLKANKARYLKALRKYKKTNGKKITAAQIKNTIAELKKINLTHTTKNPEAIRKTGISPSSELWLTPYKSCANAMDIVLGLDRCVFFTHGFPLKNFSNDFVSVSNKLINDKTTIVSSLDLFTLALTKTKKNIPCSIETKEWISSLKDYSKNLFSGKDFWEIKAEYILTFFDSISDYNTFASKNYYSNSISKAPPKQYPFLAEIKIFRAIKPDEII